MMFRESMWLPWALVSAQNSASKVYFSGLQSLLHTKLLPSATPFPSEPPTYAGSGVSYTPLSLSLPSPGLALWPCHSLCPSPNLITSFIKQGWQHLTGK